jgi:NAD-dependent dihydropyrimidine dehydrogenase PreA subunit
MRPTRPLHWVKEVPASNRLTRQAIDRAPAWRLDLYRIPWLHRLLSSRYPQLALRLLTLVGFVFILVSAQLGPRVGSRNFAIIIVWIAWWTALKFGFIPFAGRSWCSICPIALPGEWLQQGGLTARVGRRFGLHLRWPKALKGSWLQSGGFLLVGIFSAVTLTDPHITGWVLLAIFILAILMSLVFEHRAFCSYICPVGGFSGMYAKAAPLEVKVIDKEICAAHAEKSCYDACPWGLYPLALKDASSCGLCMECLRVCPKDNLALNLRSYGTDLSGWATHSRLDETFLALIMLGSALVFSATYLGPWGWLKLSAYHIGSAAWIIYALGLLLLNLVFLPGLFSSFVWLKKRLAHSTQALKSMVAAEARALIPLGLMAWIAFTISFALPKLGYIAGVLNDPLGIGWHILGSTPVPWSLNLSAISPVLVVGAILLGAVWAATTTLKNTSPVSRSSSNLPLLGFYGFYSLALLWLLLG